MPNVPLITLNNGVTIPQLGLGVFRAEEGGEVETAVTAALAAGYRLIDTAALYGNEAGVGRAVRESDIPRDEIFVTSKLWNTDQGYDSALRAFDTTMAKLGLDYLDLYLIHWPVPRQGKFVETWRAFEKLYADKRVRAIGVSNFQPVHLTELLRSAQVVPAVNQIELHPRFTQADTRAFCAAHDIKIEAWSPLGGNRGGGELLGDPIITELADRHDKTPAQIILRWHIQSGFIVIPKSVHPDRIRQNIDVFDFELSSDDLTAIAQLDTNTRFGLDPAA